MLTKHILSIGEERYELREDDLRNWGEINVSYKRAAIDGVVRSFSSSFEFVNKAKARLWKLYLRDGVNAKASIALYVKLEDWSWEKRFSSPLDFSTIEIEDFTLRLNCLDNSLAALIKAGKGTKYEFVVGEDIMPDGNFFYDRLPMLESATYEFTKGQSYDDTTNILVTFGDGVTWVGNVGSEIAVNLAIHFVDDQEDKEDAFVLKAYNPAKVKFTYDLVYVNGEGSGNVQLEIRIRRNGELVPAGQLYQGNGGIFADIKNSARRFGENKTFTSSTLPTIDEIKAELKTDNLEGVYILVSGIVWEAVRVQGSSDVWRLQSTGKNLEEYLHVRVNGWLELNLQQGDEVVIMSQAGGSTTVMFAQSTMVFGWNATGDNVTIRAIRPLTALKAVIGKMTDGAEYDISISSFNPLLSQTYLLAAESIRGIQGAKLYTSFNEFCDWMETVFGYVYHIETDNNGREKLRFMHRSEIFKSDANLNSVENATEVKYSIDASRLYSTITIGYDRKDYNSVNGRDEFNFSNTYSTGCSVTDKTLSLTSKYRADSYGIEFAAQKRNSDTSDTTSDQDVFFVACSNVGGVLKPLRSVKIEGALSDRVFNGEFSPIACIMNNQGYIGMQSEGLILKFASSTGNTEVTVDGYAMNADIELRERLATAGELEFSTDEVDEVADPDELIEVTDKEGVTYRGFLKEVDVKYAQPETAKYKLIVKEIE